MDCVHILLATGGRILGAAITIAAISAILGHRTLPGWASFLPRSSRAPLALLSRSPRAPLDRGATPRVAKMEHTACQQRARSRAMTAIRARRSEPGLDCRPRTQNRLIPETTAMTKMSELKKP